MFHRQLAACLLLLVAALPALAQDDVPKPPPRPMKQYQTRYYVIHSDLETDAVREAAARMTAMAEEYYERTKSFGGTITERMDFYLFSRGEDYYAAGGIKGSAGMYDSRRLMAIAGANPTERTWRVVQHEGFHQFSHRVIRANLPIGIEEGLAEYFANSIFTGDGFVSGTITPNQRTRVQAMIKENKQQSIEQFLGITRTQWKDKLESANYLQAWSIAHFLAHGDDGRYQDRFSRFIRGLSRGGNWRAAWQTQFGGSFDAFDKQWTRWWSELPENPTADLLDRASVATMTSFFARAITQKQTFESAEHFFKAAEADELKSHRDDWLPRSLLTGRLPAARKLGSWSIVQEPGRRPELHCQRKDGTTFVGQFTIKSNNRIDKVSVQIRKPAEPASTSQPMQ